MSTLKPEKELLLKLRVIILGGLPKDLQFKLVEPCESFKDEVRSWSSLGLPNEIIKRHPFPGPGLAIKILGDVDDEKLNC